MCQVVLHEWAEDVLTTLFQKDESTFQRLSSALDELEEKGLQASNVKRLSNTKVIFRKRVGRWRILFTHEKSVFHVWIIAVEKDTKKDYKKWIYIISCQ